MNNKLLAIVFIATLAGCSRETPLGYVQGRVTSHSKPLDGVLVRWLPQSSGEECSGVTNHTGSYELRSATGARGVAPGKYIIVLEDLAVYSHPRTEEPPSSARIESRVPRNLAVASSSRLRFLIRPGQQYANFDLSP